MITAKELLKETIDGYNLKTIPFYQFKFDKNESALFENMMIEFAKIQVEEALKQASEKARTKTNDESTSIVVDKETILKSYLLENIK